MVMKWWVKWSVQNDHYATAKSMTVYGDEMTSDLFKTIIMPQLKALPYMAVKWWVKWSVQNDHYATAKSITVYGDEMTSD